MGKFHDACFDHSWPLLVNSDELFLEFSSSIRYDRLREIGAWVEIGSGASVAKPSLAVGRSFENEVDNSSVPELFARMLLSEAIFCKIFNLARFSLMTNAVIKMRSIAIRIGTGISIEEGMLISSADIW